MKLFHNNVMLYLLIFIIMTTFATSNAKDLKVPKLIDFGECPIGTNIKPAVYMEEFYIVNISDKPIYVYDISIDYNYPPFIRSRGNYLAMFDPVSQYITTEKQINPNDTAFFSIWYYSQFIDTVSQKGYLRSGLIYKYHFEDDFTEYLDTSIIQMRSIEDKSIFTTGSNYVTWHYCENSVNKFQWNLFVTIYNKSDETYIIDSLYYNMQGNFDYKGINKVSPSDNYNFVSLPYDLASGNIVYLIAKIPFPSYSFNKINFKIFCTNKGTSENKILKDSIILRVTQPQPALMHNSFSNITAFLQDTVLKQACIWINPCSRDSLVCDSIISIGDIGMNQLSIIPFGQDFPILLNPDSINLLASIKFIALEPGEKKGEVIGFFHDKLGNQFLRYVPFYIYVYPFTNYVDEHTNNNNKLIIYPNPANDFIFVNLNENISDSKKTITIYNILGEKAWEGNSQLNLLKIPINRLSEGTYILIITNNNHFFSSKFVVRK